MIFITGDMHGDYSRYENKKLKKLREDDCLIVCGDFGFFWNDSQQEKILRNKIAEKKFRTLFVDGTHENYSLLQSYPVKELYGGRVQQLGNNIFRLLRGEIYTIEGKRFFTFGGGDSDDKDLRIENGTWFREEQPTIEEMSYAVERLDSVNRTVDYIITHQPCMKDMALVQGRCPKTPIATFFDELSQNVNYRCWYFGSLHKNKKLPQAHCLFTDIVRIDT